MAGFHEPDNQSDNWRGEESRMAQYGIRVYLGDDAVREYIVTGFDRERGGIPGAQIRTGPHRLQARSR